MIRSTDRQPGGSVLVQREMDKPLTLLGNLTESGTYCYFLDKQPVGDNIVPWLELHDIPFDATVARVALSVTAGS